MSDVHFNNTTHKSGRHPRFTACGVRVASSMQFTSKHDAVTCVRCQRYIKKFPGLYEEVKTNG